jgi:hypothetical protein
VLIKGKSVQDPGVSWEISNEVVAMDTSSFSTARRSGQYDNFMVNIMFSCASASPEEIEQLRRKLDSQSFIDALNAMGFKASRNSVPSIQNNSGFNLAPLQLVIALCSAFGFVVGVAVLVCSRRVGAQNKVSMCFYDFSLI